MRGIGSWRFRRTKKILTLQICKTMISDEEVSSIIYMIQEDEWISIFSELEF